MAMISCSGDDDRHEGFEKPFELSAGYLGMAYLGDVHVWVEDGEDVGLESRRRMDGLLQRIEL